MADDPTSEFDPARYRIATDAMEEAGFGDVADWVRGLVDRREAEAAPGTLTFLGMPLAELADRLARQAGDVRRHVGTPDGINRFYTVATLETAAQLADWLRGQVDPDAFLATPGDGGGVWRLVEIPPEHRFRNPIMMICPVCRVDTHDLDIAFMRGYNVRTFVMSGIELRVGGMPPGQPRQDLPILYVGRCPGCGVAFLG